MTNNLTVGSSHGGDKLEFEGEIPRGLTGYDDTTFRVRYTSSEVSAVVEVYNIQPHRWAIFFQELADNLRGWSDLREHESLEHHLKLSCTAGSTGHIEMRCILRGATGGANWRVEDSLFFEAGQLEGLAKRAKEYFGT